MRYLPTVTLVLSAVVIVTSLALVSESRAADAPPSSSRSSTGPGRFYFIGDLGYSKNFYSSNSAVQAFVATQTPTATSHVPLGFDLAALFRMTTRTALGIAWDGSYDYYYQNATTTVAGSSTSSTTAGAVIQNGLVLTAREYFGSHVGSGLFLREDGGLGWLSTTGNVYSTNAGLSPSSQGLFLLGGVGYSIQVGNNGAINIEGDYSRLVISGGGINTFQPKIGLMVWL